MSCLGRVKSGYALVDEVVREMSLAQATFWVAFLALIATLVYGEISRRQQKRQYILAREQLLLARDEADRHPVLEVTTVRILDPRALDEVLETRRAIGEKKAEDNERRRQRALAAQKRREIERHQATDPYYMPSVADQVAAQWPGDVYMNRGHLEESRRNYKGMFPTSVVEIELVNRGKTAAHQITGWLHFEASMRPLDFPGLDATVEDIRDADGFYRAEVGGGEGSKLLSSSSETLTYRVGLFVAAPGTTATLKYEFKTPEGDGIVGEEQIKLPDVYDRWPEL
jgi:hypothetical protein